MPPIPPTVPAAVPPNRLVSIGWRPTTSSPPTPHPSVRFFFSSRRRHTRWTGDWSSDVCSSDLSEIESRIATRIGRRQALTKHNPAKLVALIGQAALTQEIGGRQVMIEQLRHLLEMGAYPNVELRIVPDRRGWHPGLEGEFTLLETPLIPASLTTIVCVGNRRTVLILHEDDDVADYRDASGRILGVSLPADKSAAFIA